jgi:hypothetical protein
MDRYIVDDEALDKVTTIPFQISYAFTSNTRNNRWGRAFYGAKNMTFRRLYELLCRHFNKGEYFIDTYFEKVFPRTRLYEEFHLIERRIKGDITGEYFERADAAKLRKDGGFDFRTREGRWLKKFDVWRKAYVKEAYKVFADKVRLDIMSSLSSGRIPLRFSSRSQVTHDIREALGFMPMRSFFASGQLVGNLRLNVAVNSEITAWQTVVVA